MDYLERECAKLMYTHRSTKYCGTWSSLSMCPILTSKVKSRLSEVIHHGACGIKKSDYEHVIY